MLSGVGGIWGLGAAGLDYVKIEDLIYQKERTRIRFSRRKTGWQQLFFQDPALPPFKSESGISRRGVAMQECPRFPDCSKGLDRIKRFNFSSTVLLCGAMLKSRCLLYV